jgi:hypothetical protein
LTIGWLFHDCLRMFKSADSPSSLSSTSGLRKVTTTLMTAAMASSLRFFGLGFGSSAFRRFSSGGRCVVEICAAKNTKFAPLLREA